MPETLMECIDESGVASIGDSYRRQHPEWSAESVLTAEGREGSATPPANFRKRRQLLMNQISADFAGGNLVQIQGWILSQFEAEQCARLSAKPH